MKERREFVADLKKSVSGEVLTDELSRGIYATDASLYQITPEVVVIPSSEDDVIRTVELASQYRIPIISRGGGTSLAGQTIGQGIVIDFTKHLNKILEINPELKFARVQPGLIRDELNLHTQQYGLHFAPDPATSSRAAMGGMIANNSSGTKSILYGKTIDHVLELKVLLADGSILHLRPRSMEEIQLEIKKNSREGQIYRVIKKIIEENKDEIADRFPKVMRRVGGYNLDTFLKTDYWNLCNIIIGSEGTLGIILEAKINLEPLPKHKGLTLVHFETLKEAIKAVMPIITFKPAAVEILDNTVISLSRKNLTTQRSTKVVQGDPAAVLLVEFYGDTEKEVADQASSMTAFLKKNNAGYAFPFYPEGKAYEDVWTIRKKGLGLMLGMKGDKKPIAFIEDACIPLPHLHDYIEQIIEICKQNNTQVAIYAHASVGVIHVRPILDMRQEEDINRFKTISQASFDLVRQYGGAWSGEHGDGLVRSHYNELFFGEKVYAAFKSIKKLFDPANLMNPGKIVDAPPIDQSLRYGTSYRDQTVDTIFKYRTDGTFEAAVHMCSGVGECRKTLTGTMCPSYMATLDEEHSTRGRANALRLAMSGQFRDSNLASNRLLQAMDLCLSCKACKSECPSNVDMAKLKSEVLQKKHDLSGTKLRDLFIRDSSKFARHFSGRPSKLINAIQHSSSFRSIMDKTAGIAKQRRLPSYSSTTFTKWYADNYIKPSGSARKVVLFADTYLNYHEPQVGIAAVNLLASCGYEVLLADAGCCQRPRISNGFLQLAKKDGTKTFNKLLAFALEDLPILVCEPSCASALKDDLPDLIEDYELVKKVQSRIFMIDVFLFKEMEQFPALKIKPGYNKILLHGHCHQKSLFGTEAMKIITSRSTGFSMTEVDSGCCGMAGAFGYEKEHFALSKSIGARRLFPAVEQSDSKTAVVACGFSCRHQIADFTARKAKHWVEIFDTFESEESYPVSKVSTVLYK